MGEVENKDNDLHKKSEEIAGDPNEQPEDSGITSGSWSKDGQFHVPGGGDSHPGGDDLSEDDVNYSDEQRADDGVSEASSKIAENLIHRKEAFPKPSSPPPLSVSLSCFNVQELDSACQTFIDEGCYLIYGDAYVNDFAYGIFHRLIEREPQTAAGLCRIICSEDSVLTWPLEDFYEYIKANLCNDNLIIHLPLKSRSYFCEQFFNENFLSRLVDMVTGEQCNSALLIVIDQQREHLPAYLIPLLSDSSACKVPWHQILVNHWQQTFSLVEEEYEYIAQHLQRVISADPIRAARWAEGVTELVPSSSDLDGNDRGRWFVDSINISIRDGERMVADKLIQLMAPGWRQPLRLALMSFYCLLSVNHRVSYDTLARLGKLFLYGSTLRVPVEMEETIESHSCDSNLLGELDKPVIVKRVNEYQDSPAEQVWESSYDQLIRECGLETDIDQKGVVIRENPEVWLSSLLPAQIYRCFPGAVRRVYEDVLKHQYLFPNEPTDIPWVQDYANVLLAIHQRDPNLAPLMILVTSTLNQGVAKVAKQLQGVNSRAKVNELWDYAALGIAFLFVAINGLNIPSDEKDRIYRDATEKALDNYYLARLLVGAFEMLTQRHDFSPNDYLFTILTHKWKNKGYGRAELWRAVRDGFVERMRKSIEYRKGVLFELHKRLADDTRAKALSIMEARLWYDAIRSDFNRDNIKLEETFADTIKSSERQQLVKLVTTFSSLAPNSIAVGGISREVVGADLARMLVRDADCGKGFPVSLNLNSLREWMREQIQQTQAQNIVRSLELAKTNPEFNTFLDRLVDEQDPVNRAYWALRMEESQQGREWIAEQFYIYTQFCNIVLAEWAGAAAGYPIGIDNPEGQDVIEHYLRVLTECLDEATLKSICKDWLMAAHWLQEMELWLDPPSGIAEDVLDQYMDIKQRLRDKSDRYKGMRSWILDTLKQPSSKEITQ